MSVSYARFVESNDLKYALVYYTTQSSCQMLGMVPFILLKPVKNDQVFFQITVFAEIGTFEFPCLPLLSGRLSHVLVYLGGPQVLKRSEIYQELDFLQ